MTYPLAPPGPAIPNAVVHAYRAALPKLGRYADDPSVRNLLKTIIKARMSNGSGDPAAVADAAVDEIILSTSGRVHPFL